MPDLKEYKRRFKKLGLPESEQDRRVDAILRKANDPKPLNLDDFNRRMIEATKALPAEALVLVQRKLTFDLLKRAVEKTPVDTGRARGNWHVSVDKLTKKTWKGTKNATGAKRDPLEDAPGILETLGPFAVSYVQNNLEYISYLEDGTSDQAPNGMLAVSFEELKETFS